MKLYLCVCQVSFEKECAEVWECIDGVVAADISAGEFNAGSDVGISFVGDEDF